MISPSLDGILRHESIVYQGIARPSELLRIMDAPASRTVAKKGKISDVVYTPAEQKVIQEYFQDLHRLFMKNFSQFIIETEPKSDEGVKLLAMLQEMIKIKKLL